MFFDVKQHYAEICVYGINKSEYSARTVDSAPKTQKKYTKSELYIVLAKIKFSILNETVCSRQRNIHTPLFLKSLVQHSLNCTQQQPSQNT
jgi:hypothetical protein